jgi:hypothetical protein
MQDRLFRKVALERAASPERLDTLMQVTQPRGWLLLVVVALFLVALAVWSVTARVRTTVDSQGILIQEGEHLQAILYLTAEQIQNVTLGLDVLIAPVSISTQQYGFLKGQVLSVARQPVTTAESYAGTPFEVHIQLQRDDETATGYAWTLSKGPNTILLPTTPLTGIVILKETRPIDQLIP